MRVLEPLNFDTRWVRGRIYEFYGETIGEFLRKSSSFDTTLHGIEF